MSRLLGPSSEVCVLAAHGEESCAPVVGAHRKQLERALPERHHHSYPTPGASSLSRPVSKPVLTDWPPLIGKRAVITVKNSSFHYSSQFFGRVVLQIGKLVLRTGKVVLRVRKMILRVRELVLRVREMALQMRKMILRVREMALRVREMILRVREMILRLREMALRLREMALRVREMALRVREMVLRVRELVLWVWEMALRMGKMLLRVGIMDSRNLGNGFSVWVTIQQKKTRRE